MQAVFDRTASSYGEKGCRYFDEFGKQLVAFARLKPGDKVLDVATGKGAILLPAAEVVGKTGTAIGIDLSPVMIEEARKRTSQISVHLFVMDAEKLAFPAHFFDVVFCGFSLFFFPNLSLVLNEWKRVLKPQGQIAVSTWGRPPPLTEWVVKRAEERGALKQLKAQTIDTAEALIQILTKAGFSHTDVREKEETFWHDTPEEWFDSLLSHATRARLEQLTPADFFSLRQETLEYVKKTKTLDGRVAEDLHAIFGIAQ